MNSTSPDPNPKTTSFAPCFSTVIGGFVYLQKTLGDPR